MTEAVDVVAGSNVELALPLLAISASRRKLLDFVHTLGKLLLGFASVLTETRDDSASLSFWETLVAGVAC